MNRPDYVHKLMKVDISIFLFIISNLSASFLQILVFSLLLLCNTNKLERLVTHVIIHSITLTILILGCYFYYQRQEYFYIKANDDGQDISVIEKSQQQVMRQVRFTISLMLWFRFLEWIMCSCLYVSTFISTCCQTQEEDGDMRRAHHRTTHQTHKKNKKRVEEIDKFIQKHSKRFSEEQHGGMTCSICLEDLTSSCDKQGGKEQSSASTTKVVQLNCTARHVFHTHCIKSWLTVKRTCPSCREVIVIKKCEC